MLSAVPGLQGLVSARCLASCITAVLLVNTGCISLPHPRGAWAEPVVVPLPEAPLKGARVGIECASSPLGEQAWSPGLFEGCRDLARLTKAMGATVVAAAALLPAAAAGQAEDSELFIEAADEANGAKKVPVDFTIRYVDRDHERDYCGWTLPLFLLSFSLFPCIEDVSSHAEIRLVDGAGSVQKTVPLQIDVRNIYGVLGLYYLTLHSLGLPESTAQRQQRQSRRLVRYVESLVYSYRLRTQLQARREVEGPR